VRRPARMIRAACGARAGTISTALSCTAFGPAVVLPDREHGTERAYAAFGGLHNERAVREGGCMTSDDPDLAGHQMQQAALRIETQIDRAVGVEHEARAVGQHPFAALAHAG